MPSSGRTTSVAIAASRRRGRPRHDSAAAVTTASTPKRSTRQRSGTGYWPYMNWAKRARMKTQQAPALVQSSREVPRQLASTSSQSTSGSEMRQTT